jgi:hypothetical protein
MSYNKTKQLKNVPVECILICCHKFHNPEEPNVLVSSLERIITALDIPERLAYKAMYKADQRGFIEYGTSIRGAWVTQKGYEFMTGKGFDFENNEYNINKDGSIVSVT